MYYYVLNTDLPDGSKKGDLFFQSGKANIYLNTRWYDYSTKSYLKNKAIVTDILRVLEDPDNLFDHRFFNSRIKIKNKNHEPHSINAVTIPPSGT
jgi:hypothetical protein